LRSWPKKALATSTADYFCGIAHARQGFAAAAAAAIAAPLTRDRHDGARLDGRESERYRKII